MLDYERIGEEHSARDVRASAAVARMLFFLSFFLFGISLARLKALQKKRCTATYTWRDCAPMLGMHVAFDHSLEGSTDASFGYQGLIELTALTGACLWSRPQCGDDLNREGIP